MVGLISSLVSNLVVLLDCVTIKLNENSFSCYIHGNSAEGNASESKGSTFIGNKPISIPNINITPHTCAVDKAQTKSFMLI